MRCKARIVPDLIIDNPAHRVREAAKRPTGKAGRNLPLAIISGLLLMGVLSLSLFWDKQVYIYLMAAFMIRGSYEISRGFRAAGVFLPFIPLAIGSASACFAAYYAQEPGIIMVTVATVVVVAFVRMLVGFVPQLAKYALLDTKFFDLPQTVTIAQIVRKSNGNKDIVAIALSVLYVTFLGATSLLLVSMPHGEFFVLFAILLASSSDTGGWAFGVLWGKHPLAPSISPKKSWEGLLGSLVCTTIMTAICVYFIPFLDWSLLYYLPVLGVVAATLGDLGESLLKRDLGIKDMGQVFPGHGGVLDRVDSILFVVPVLYVVLLLHG